MSKTAHRTKSRLSKHNDLKYLNPSFLLPRIALKDAGQMEDALSTMVLPAKICTDQVKDKFCPISRPQVGTSLSGSTMSSTVQARLEKRTSQESTCSEKTVQKKRLTDNRKDKNRKMKEICFDHFKKIKEKETEHLEHFTAEPVRDDVLEKTTSYQEVITTPIIHPQEE